MKPSKNLTLFERHRNYIGRRYSSLYSIFFSITTILFPLLSTTLFPYYYYCIIALFLSCYPSIYLGMKATYLLLQMKYWILMLRQCITNEFKAILLQSCLGVVVAHHFEKMNSKWSSFATYPIFAFVPLRLPSIAHQISIWIDVFFWIVASQLFSLCLTSTLEVIFLFALCSNLASKNQNAL